MGVQFSDYAIVVISNKNVKYTNYTKLQLYK